MFRRGLGRSARSYALVLTMAAAIVLGWQLMAPPVAGMANNGDFGKLLGRFGMGSEAGFDYANTKYFFGDQHRYHSGFNSSELLLIVPALAINRVISRDGSFDLRVMGAVHASVFLLAIFLLFRSCKSWWLGPAALLLFCDFMYTGYFNSFYMDTAAYLFTLLAAVFYIRAVRRPGAVETAGLLVAMLLAITSKPQYAMLGPWFALLFWAGRGILCGGSKRKAAIAVAALWFTTWISYRFLAPEAYRAKTAFTVIFSQVVPHAQNPEQALAELGLDHSYARWIGMNAYWPGTMLDDPEFYRPFLQRTSLGKIAAFYWHHPADTWSALGSALDDAGSMLPPGGNFDSGLGMPAGARYGSFQLLSNWKRRLFHHHGVRFLFCVFGTATLAAVMLVWNRERLPDGAVSGGVVLSAMAALLLVMSGLADVYEQARHQLVSFALFDVLLLVTIGLLVEFRPLRLPGQLILVAAACAVGAGCFLYRPVPPPAGELDDYYWRIGAFAIWNAVFLAGFRLFVRPRQTRRVASHFLAGAAVCVLFAGWLLFRITPAGPGQYDDFDHRVRLTGAWSRDAQFATAFHHSLTYSDAPNAAFRLAFRGPEISWVYTMAANRGIAAVYVDGQARGEVDLYSAETQWQQRTVFGGLGVGDHVFEVRVMGRKNAGSLGGFVDVDGLVVR